MGESFAIAFAKARKEQGATQEDAADLLDVSIGTIRNYEQGRTLPLAPIRRLIFEKFPSLSTKVR